MKRTLIVLLIVLAPLALLALRPGPVCRVNCRTRTPPDTATLTAAATATATPIQSPTNRLPPPVPASVYSEVPEDGPTCVFDWGLPATQGNIDRLLRCMQRNNIRRIVICPPTSSDWFHVFGNLCYPSVYPTLVLPPPPLPPPAYPPPAGYP